MAEFFPLHNGESIALDQIPLFDFPEFSAKLLGIAKDGYIVQYFGFLDGEQLFAMAVMRADAQLLAGYAKLPEKFPSLTAKQSKFNVFEREIAEQFGVIPEGHPWFKMVRYHSNWRACDDAFGNDYSEDIPGRYPYYTVHGEEVHEVAVGPVHAGIIEPGHFRFQCIGERVFHLEISHGYQHRGIEQLLVSSAANRVPFIVEGIAGDTAMANTVSYSQAIEALLHIEVSRPAKTIRTIALELERLSNHVGDLGALAADVAFTPPAAFFGRMRGEFLNLLLLLSGNRFGRGLIRPGGINFATEQDKIRAIQAKLAELRPELTRCIDLLLTAHTVLSRFEQCGVVSRESAEAFGMVGPAGRASWLPYDARQDFATERYFDLPPCTLQYTTGDVLARTRIRATEIMHSFDCMAILLQDFDNDVERTQADPNSGLPPSSFVVTINEAWRGELSHCLLTDSSGAISRYKVKDPSFHNWSGLAMALRDEGISDFPINNKSFNLSYCGMDL
jgi:Ni,Fe-hydrogenase III large subunit